MKKNVRIWSLNCPPDYVAIGYIATKSPDYPKQGDIYCVRRYFVELGNLNTDKTGQENIWKEVWNSLKTRANLKGRAQTSFFAINLIRLLILKMNKSKINRESKGIRIKCMVNLNESEKIMK